jgi:hypothetical protein
MGLLGFLKRSKPQEPVALPVILSNVAYMVCGEKSYGGELIIAPEAIYYFPHTNLSPQDRSKEKIVWTGVRDFIRSYWHQEINPSRQGSEFVSTNSPVEEKIEGLIKHVKENRQDALLVDSVPSPMKFSRGGINNMQAGWGSLKFEANFDDHEFRDLDGSLLERALKAGNYKS